MMTIDNAVGGFQAVRIVPSNPSTTMLDCNQ
jgi:hypothetical protein